MAEPTFTGVDDDAFDADEPVHTAVLQRVDENAQWCRLHRGPQSTLAFDKLINPSGTLGAPKMPRFGFAQWALIGPFPVFVPDGADLRDLAEDGTCTVDMLFSGIVDGVDFVSVAALSADAIPDGFGPQWCETSAPTNWYVGERRWRITVRVRPGVVNRIYLAMRSSFTITDASADVQITNANGFGRVVSIPHGDLSHTSAAWGYDVPYLAVAPSADGTTTAASATQAFTVGLVIYDSGTNKWPSALIAEQVSVAAAWAADNAGEWDQNKTGGCGWGALDTLTIYSVAVDFSMYGARPDRVNNGALRAFQAAGTSLERLAVNVQQLDRYRRSQWPVWPRPMQLLDADGWSGMWTIQPLYTMTNGGTRAGTDIVWASSLVSPCGWDTSLRLRLRFGFVGAILKPSGADAVDGEMSVRVVVYDPSTGSAIIDTTKTVNVPTITESTTLRSGSDPIYGGLTTAWMRVAGMASGYRGTAPELQPNEWADTSGQPWSHDGAVDIRDVSMLSFVEIEIDDDEFQSLTLGGLYEVKAVLTSNSESYRPVVTGAGLFRWTLEPDV